jgi:hypothetical protein
MEPITNMGQMVQQRNKHIRTSTKGRWQNRKWQSRVSHKKLDRGLEEARVHFAAEEEGSENNAFR